MVSLRAKKCQGCGNRFQPERAAQLVCSPECAEDFARAQAAKRERIADRAKAEAMKSLRELANDAQMAFNAYIRARDARKGCICCGKPFEEDRHGGAIDAGHFISRAAAPALRFDEHNCFAQRKNCNRPGGATYAAFRAGVVERVGLAEVLRLEGPHAARKWTREELIAIKATYNAKRSELVKAEKARVTITPLVKLNPQEVLL